MTVKDFLDLLVDGDIQKIELFDNQTSKVVFVGFGSDMPDKYQNVEIDSIDNVLKDNDGIITINISEEDE